jgi:hypothetical protein
MTPFLAGTTGSTRFKINPKGMLVPPKSPTEETVRKWLGADHYDHNLSVAANLLQATISGNLPTAEPITLSRIVFDLGAQGEIAFPENVTLDACLVQTGNVSFHHGTANAVKAGAIVVACGDDATANASAGGAEAFATASGAVANATTNRAHAYANAFGATANAAVEGAEAHAMKYGTTANAVAERARAYAHVSGAEANAPVMWAQAYATESGATANAMALGARAIAGAYSKACEATANSTVNGAQAVAQASRAIANATAEGASANACGYGSVANATVKGAVAYAMEFGSTANATVKGAEAHAKASSGSTANATADGAQAIAGGHSIAIARHALALASIENVKDGAPKAMQYGEFIAMRGNLNRFEDKNKSERERAGAGFLIGMAFCDGNDVKQSDKLATFFLTAAHKLGHPTAAFELGELYSKKRSLFRRDLPMANDWYSKETSEGKKIRELALKYALLRQSRDETNSVLQSLPKDVINVIGDFLSSL